MSVDLFFSTLCITALAFVYLLLRRVHRLLPPGPPAAPFLGNIIRFPTAYPWITFTEWKQRYGDIVCLHGLGNTLVVLNTMETVRELLDKRGHLYSHRPILVMAGELMGLDKTLGNLPNNKEWRLQRKLIRAALSPEAIKKYEKVEEDLAALLNSALLNTPEDFFAHIRLTAGRIILSITYGLPVKTVDSEYITHAEATMEIIERAYTPGSYLVDFIPMLKYLPRWMPFTSFFEEGRKGRNMIDKLVTAPFEYVKREMKYGRAQPCIIYDLLTSEGLNTEDQQSVYEERVKLIGGALYGAAGETTYVTLLNMILAMALNPDKQRLAQEELDRVIGADALPELKDRSSLSYVNAVLKETMRWRPALPLGLARRTDQDDVYNGRFIPAGSIVIPNVWAIARDTYNPDEFIPERFMEDDSRVTDPYSYAFGFGRRVCPGKGLGETSLFIVIATILANFEISPALNDDGNKIPLNPKFSNQLISYPEPFQCRILPRSAKRARLVKERAAACKI